MIKAMDALYKLNARSERYEITKTMIQCKMAEGSSVSEHVATFAGYADRLKALEFPIPPSLVADMILASLPPSYDGFIINYNMNGMDKTPNELFAMLKTAEAGM